MRGKSSTWVGKTKKTLRGQSKVGETGMNLTLGTVKNRAKEMVEETEVGEHGDQVKGEVTFPLK